MKKFIKEAMREHKCAVEEMRSIAAKQRDRADFYSWSLWFWQMAPNGARMMDLVREAAALDGIQLKDE